MTCGSPIRVSLNAARPGGNYCSRECSYKRHGRGVVDNGDGTASIELAGDLVATIDSSDIPLVEGYSWQPFHHRNTTYATARIKGRKVYLHRLLTNAAKGELCDHRDLDGLNNRRSNLRHCTNGENLRNRGAQSNNKSGLKGVTTHGPSQYSARIGDTYLGSFRTPQEAAIAYDKAAIVHHGEFARTNYPQENYQ